MNERIRELEKQCWSHYIDGVLIDGHLHFDTQKFVELIVKECILTIQMGITRDGHNTEQYLRSVKHIKQIKEHFGVEE